MNRAKCTVLDRHFLLRLLTRRRGVGSATCIAYFLSIATDKKACKYQCISWDSLRRADTYSVLNYNTENTKSIWLPCGLREADSEICDEGNRSYSSAFGGLTFKKYKKHGCIKVKKKSSVSNKKLSLLVTAWTQLNILFWQSPGLTVFLHRHFPSKRKQAVISRTGVDRERVLCSATWKTG